MRHSSYEILKASSDLEEAVGRILIEKNSKRAYGRLLKKLQLSLINNWNDQRNKSVQEVNKYLLKKGGEKFTKTDVAKVDKIFNKYLGVDFERVVEDVVIDTQDKAYKQGAIEITQPAKLRISFSVSDRNATDILGNHALYWCRNYYDDQLTQKIDGLLGHYFNSDFTIKDVIDSLSKDLKSIDKKNTEQYFEGLAEHVTNRTRELGKVAGLEFAGVENYIIVARVDDRTSKLCKKLNGTKIPVKRAVEFRDKILALRDPEDIKKFAPWRTESSVDNLDTSRLPMGLSLPPYHFRCRTQIIADL